METVQSYLNKAREDKFLLVFDTPPILKAIATKYNRGSKKIIPDSVQFSIFGTAIPDITVKATEVRYAGSTLYVSSHSKDSYPPVEVEFMVDSLYNNYYVIFKWLNLLHDQKTGVYNQDNNPVDHNFNDYMTDMTIYGLDEYGKKRISFKYTKAFPTTIKGITYTQQGDQGQEIKSGFTFVFSQVHVEMLNEI